MPVFLIDDHSSIASIFSGLFPSQLILGWIEKPLDPYLDRGFVSNAPTMTPRSQSNICPIFKMDKSSSPFGQQCLDDDSWRSSEIWDLTPFFSEYLTKIREQDAMACPPSNKSMATSGQLACVGHNLSSDTFAPSGPYIPLWPHGASAPLPRQHTSDPNLGEKFGRLRTLIQQILPDNKNLPSGFS